jgi:hypothetical protein
VIPEEPNFHLDQIIKDYQKLGSNSFKYFFNVIANKWGKDKEAAHRTTIDLFLLEVIEGVDYCQVSLV